MKGISAAFVVTLLFACSAEAVPVTWTFSGVADSGHWNADPLAGLSYELRLSADINPAQFGLGDWSNLAGEIDVQGLGTHTFAFCTTNSPASCNPAPFQFLETFSIAGADQFHFRGPAGLGDSRVNVPLGALGSDPELLTAVGPLLTLGDGTSHILARDGTPSMAVIPVFELLDTDSPETRITATVTIGDSTSVPEGASSLSFLMIGVASFAVIRRARNRTA